MTLRVQTSSVSIILKSTTQRLFLRYIVVICRIRSARLLRILLHCTLRYPSRVSHLTRVINLPLTSRPKEVQNSSNNENSSDTTNRDTSYHPTRDLPLA